MKHLIFAGFAILAAGAAAFADEPQTNFVVEKPDYLGCDSVFLTEAPKGYLLVWSDEFDSPESLVKTWEAVDWPARVVNNELQTYKPSDVEIEAADGTLRHTAEVADGKLKINCFKGADGKIYSARMNSRNPDTDSIGAWKYGYIEARIKIPSGLGTWPAFWMMPAQRNNQPWPDCGEIDIMEAVGADPDICVCSLHASGHNHTNNTQVSARKPVEMENKWVTYAMLWDEDHIEMYADGQQILNYANDGQGYRNWPYDKPYYLTLNLAWGGDWGGYKGVDESALPVAMEVDYVRVYQK